MKVKDICKRQILNARVSPEALIDTFANIDSLLWPWENWPRDAFESTLAEGCIGGHGDTKYQLASYLSGEKLIFKFISPHGYEGYHGFQINQSSGGVVEIQHIFDVNLSLYHWVMWKTLIYWVHRSLIYDSFDKAELYLTGKIISPNRWPWRVYIIRHALGGARIVKNFFMPRIFLRK